ncbi:TPA: ead/Ea22-like family protein [Escherichia coli]|uniref:ead/Ea22-like family protein n=1 Tax=Escherichia coli TaxID=562 RepID=UPI000BE6E080|nr:ead/Ea22-like family protein [Escherichia coli]
MKFSKFSELVNRILLNRILSNNHSHRRDMDVTIVVHSPGSIGSTPSVEVQSIHAGFDWDSGKVLIFPAQPLTTLTPEQITHITDSVRKGQSWHAYQEYKKHKEQLEKLSIELDAAKQRIAELEGNFTALAAENAGIKSAIPESRDIEDDNDNMDDVSLAEDFGFNHAIERMRRQIPETPTTDAFLAEVRAQGVDAAIEAAKNLVAQEYEYKDFKAAQSDCCMYPGSDLVGKVEMTEWLVDFAAQLRKGGNQ